MNTASVAQHYGSAGIADRVLAAFREANGPDAAVTPEALAPFDHFHGRGVAATQELARGLQGLAVRCARAINHGAGRCGPVWDQRYHAHSLATPRQVRAGLAGLRLQSSDSRFDVGVLRRGGRRNVHDAIDNQRLHFKTEIEAKAAGLLRTCSVIESPRLRQLGNVRRRDLRQRRKIRIVLVVGPLRDGGCRSVSLCGAAT